MVASTPFEAVTLKTESGGEFKVNGKRLKQYLGGSMKEEIQIWKRDKEITETEDTLQPVSS